MVRWLVGLFVGWLVGWLASLLALLAQIAWPPNLLNWLFARLLALFCFALFWLNYAKLLAWLDMLCLHTRLFALLWFAFLCWLWQLDFALTVCLVCSLECSDDSRKTRFWTLSCFALICDALRALLARFCLDYLICLACSLVWTPKTQPGGSRAATWLSFWCSTRPCLRALR